MIIAIDGPAGSGKSTVGVILAKMTSRHFVDTDVLIQTSNSRSLQAIVDAEGHMALRRIEEGVLLDLGCVHTVIATGGSAVYSHAAMTHLKSNGVVVSPDVSCSDCAFHSADALGISSGQKGNTGRRALWPHRIDVRKAHAFFRQLIDAWGFHVRGSE